MRSLPTAVKEWEAGEEEAAEWNECKKNEKIKLKKTMRRGMQKHLPHKRYLSEALACACFFFYFICPIVRLFIIFIHFVLHRKHMKYCKFLTE